MATITQQLGTRTNLGSLGTLATGTYLNVGTITFNTNKPLEVVLEVSATPGSVSGTLDTSPQMQLFVYGGFTLCARLSQVV